MKNQKGFSLIELLIVVVIIGIIAAIAIPNLLAARRSANEGSAASSLRTIHGASATYQATSGVGNFPCPAVPCAANATVIGAAAQPNLAALNAVNLVDAVLGQGTKSGFNFAYAQRPFVTGTEPATFAAAAHPQVTSGITMTGTREFGIVTDGVLVTRPIPQPAGTTILVPATGSAANGATFGPGDNTTVVMGNQ